MFGGVDKKLKEPKEPNVILEFLKFSIHHDQSSPAMPSRFFIALQRSDEKSLGQMEGEV